MTYAADRLFEEVAYVAYYFHWSLDDILDLEHPLRQRLIEEICRIHRQMGEQE
jgi:hypothetical protein